MSLTVLTGMISQVMPKSLLRQVMSKTCGLHAVFGYPANYLFYLTK